MLTEKERADFKIALIRQNMTQRDFCRERGFNYRTFRQGLCGAQPLVKGAEAAIREFIAESGE